MSSITGSIHEIGTTQQVSDSFKKRDLVIKYAENPSYPEFIKLEAIQDKTGLFDKFKVGEEVEVHFNLRGKPFTDRNGKTSYFNSLVVWKINSASSSTPGYSAPADINSAPQDDDLPF